MATYIGRLETGRNARKTGAIALKGAGRGGGSKSGGFASKRTGFALLGEHKASTTRRKLDNYGMLK